MQYFFNPTKTIPAALALCCSLLLHAAGSAQVIIDSQAIHHGERYPNGAVASQNFHASQVGADILAQGGNAVDAAVAVGFALAVVLPRAGNIGGGGFMMVHDSEKGATEAIDYREMAPISASRDMYLDETGQVDKQKVRYSHAASGVPGTVAGLWHAHSKYGVLEWKTLLQPAISLAEKGFAMTDFLASALEQRKQLLGRSLAAAKVFYKPDGSNYKAGEIFRQPDLARTLRLIAKAGKKGFYSGPVARAIEKEMQRSGGHITRRDLRDYRVAVREPVVVEVAGYKVEMMPPPSSGGLIVGQLLKVYETLGLAAWPFGGAESIHLMVEPMKQAYADRSLHLGDPDFYPVPAGWMLSDQRIGEIVAAVEKNRARPASEISPGAHKEAESSETTHYSVVDKDGNVVSNTYTLNFSFGSGVVIPGYGFLMNNEMDDFSAKPGSPNAFGLLGAQANAVAPGKRPLSSMTPTIVHKDGSAFMALGSPGGSRIISTVLEVLTAVLFYDKSLAEAINAPRFHHQWLPDMLFVERPMNPDTIAILQSKGHQVSTAFASGSVQAVIRSSEGWTAVADPRRPDAGTAGH